MAARKSDFDGDGDGRAEMFVSSPWGIGLPRQQGSTLAPIVMAPSGTRFGGWLLNTADNRFELGEQTVRLHGKVLTTPTTSIERMVEAMQRVDEGVGIRVQRVGAETLTLPALNDVDVGACTMGSTTGDLGLASKATYRASLLAGTTKETPNPSFATWRGAWQVQALRGVGSDRWQCPGVAVRRAPPRTAGLQCMRHGSSQALGAPLARTGLRRSTSARRAPCQVCSGSRR